MFTTNTQEEEHTHVWVPKSIASKLEDKRSYKELRFKLFRGKFVKSSGEPIKCFHCCSADLKEKVNCTDGGFASEVDMLCNSCGKVTGFWGYGYWEQEPPMTIVGIIGEVFRK